MGKRGAGHQLVKDGHSSSGDEDGVDQKIVKDIPVSQRVISRPVSRMAKREGSGSGNSFKDLKIQKATLGTQTSIGSLEKDALINLKSLNSYFLKAVEESLKKDTYIDLSSLFDQYRMHRSTLDQQFDLGEKTRLEKLELGFIHKKPLTVVPMPEPLRESMAKPMESVAFKAPEIRPVSVNLPSFAVKEAPPTPVIMEDKSELPTMEKKANTPFSFSPPQTQSPQANGQEGFSFPSVSSLPAFGSTGQAASKPLFSFGATEESAKPLFKFESTATTTAFAFPTAPSFSSTGSFAFGQQPSQHTQPKLELHNDEDDGDNTIPAGEEDSFSSIRTNDDLIMTGKGEEEEEQLFAPLRSKLFIYDTTHFTWTDLGIGLIKVNKERNSARARVLCRAEGSGRVLLNAFLDAKVCTTQHTSGKKELTLTCFNQDSRLAKYLIRTKESAQAASLHDVLSQQLT